jgi:L-ascorbate metabolism protein UlaG (beta-lactamase superfamily)
MFAFEIDGLRIVHLGLPDAAPTRAQLDDLGEIDVLLLPVGNPASYNARMAVDVMSEIDPPVAIPMDFSPDGKNGLAGVDGFLKELGVTPEPQPMLRLTRASIPSELTVMLLEARGQA